MTEKSHLVELPATKAKEFSISPQVTEGLAKNAGELAKLKDAKTGTLIIRTITGEQEAHRLLTQYQDYGDAIVLARDAALRPLLDDQKMIRERAKVHLAPIESAMETLEYAIKENKRWKDDEARKAQQAIIDAHTKAVVKEEKRAEKKGEAPKPVAPPPIVAQPEKTVVVGDAKRTFVDHWVPSIEGVAEGKEADLTLADFLVPPFNEFAKKNPRLFKLDWKTIGATIRAGKGTNPYGAPIVVKNDQIISTTKV